MQLVDTHCHLNDQEAFPDPATAICEADKAGVSRLVVIGVDLESSRIALELAEKFESVFAVVGWHPNYAASYRPADIDQIRSMLGHPKALAIGEIGLDFYRDYASREDQYRCLQDQLDLARELEVPIVFHCREAYPELLEVLENRPPHKYLFHCFAGNHEQAERAKRLDCWFGVDGPITYKNSAKLKEVLLQLPREKLLIETDSPWLTPEPFRGQRNRPALLPHINNLLAQTLGISSAECASLTTKNASDFFGVSF